MTSPWLFCGTETILVLSNQLLLRQLSLGELDGLLARGLGSLDVLLLLLSEELNVARSVHVGVDSSVGSVSSSSAALGLVALNVGEDQLLNVQRLALGVGDQVLEQTDDHLGGLHGPATLGVLELLGLGSSANLSVETAEGDASLLLEDGVQILDGISHLVSSDGRADLEGVLEVNTDVGTSSFAS